MNRIQISFKEYRSRLKPLQKILTGIQNHQILRAFDSDVDLVCSNTDIIWDSKLILAYVTFSDFCVKQADRLSLGARESRSCSSSLNDKVVLCPQNTKLFEDPIENFRNRVVSPLKGLVEEGRPRFLGLLSEEQIRERKRLEGKLWVMNHPPDDSEDPCAPYRYELTPTTLVD